MIKWFKEKLRKHLQKIFAFILGGGLVLVAVLVDGAIPKTELLETSKENIISSGVDKDNIVYYSFIDSLVVANENEVITPLGKIKLLKQESLGEGLIKQTFLAVGQPGINFYKRGDNWYGIGHGTTTKKSFDRQTSSYLERIFKKVFATETSSSSASNDGAVVQTTDAAFTVMHDGAGELNQGGTADSSIMCGSERAAATADVWDNIARGTFPFPITALLGTTSTAVSSTVSFTGEGTAGDTFTEIVHVVSKTNHGTILQNSDYASSSFGTTSFGSRTVADWPGAGTMVGLLLNQDGLDFINQQILAATTTTFGTRLNGDRTRTSPTWSNAGVSLAGCLANETATPGDRPTLYIEYTAIAAEVGETITTTIIID